MRKSKWFARVAIVSMFAIAAAACSDAGDSGDGGGDGGEGGGETITIAVNPWTGSAVNANIAKIIMEDQL